MVTAMKPVEIARVEESVIMLMELVVVSLVFMELLASTRII